MQTCGCPCRRTVTLHTFALLAIITGLMISCATSRSDQTAPQSLRVNELVVVDDQGVERVRIGGNLPDAVIRGKRVPRGDEAAGILLYDDTGQERSGYLTWKQSGNVGLTLDSRSGQVAFIVAAPEPGVAARLWHGGDYIELRSDADGSRVTAAKSRAVVFQQPPFDAPERTEFCAAHQELRGKHSDEQILQWCKERMTEAACRNCLGLP